MISDSSGNQIQIFHNFQFSRPARSGDEVKLPAHLLRPGHAVDHDVGQAVPPPPPASEAAAVESDAVIPVQRLLRILALHTSNHYNDNTHSLPRAWQCVGPRT